MHHPTGRIGLCYTSRGALGGTRKASVTKSCLWVVKSITVVEMYIS